LATELRQRSGAVDVARLLEQSNGAGTHRDAQEQIACWSPPASQGHDSKGASPHQQEQHAQAAHYFAASTVDQLFCPPGPGSGADKVPGGGIESPGEFDAFVETGSSSHRRDQRKQQ
jgi:hypothetical protein